MLKLIEGFLSSRESNVGPASSSPVTKTAREKELESFLKKLSIQLALASSLCDSAPNQLSVDQTVDLTLDRLLGDVTTLTVRFAEIQKLLFTPSEEVQANAAPSSPAEVYNADTLQERLNNVRDIFIAINQKIAEEQKVIVQDFTPPMFTLTKAAASSVHSDEPSTSEASSEEPKSVSDDAEALPQNVGAKVVEGKINHLIGDHNAQILSIRTLANRLHEELASTAGELQSIKLVTLMPEESEKFSRIFNSVNMQFVQELYQEKNMPIINALDARMNELVGLMSQIEKWKGESLKPVQDIFNTSIAAYKQAYTYGGTVPTGFTGYFTSPNAELAKTEFTKVETL